MKKLITDSQVLMDMLFDDANCIENTQLYMMIENLKAATLNCSELCVTIEFEDFEATRRKLAAINLTLTDTWRTLAMLQNDFKECLTKTTRQ